MHDSVLMQVCEHEPQLLLSVCSSTHDVPQTDWPEVLQVVAQTPLPLQLAVEPGTVVVH